jgi:transcriptional regulator
MASDQPALARLSIALTSIEQAASDNVERSVEIQRRVRWLHEQIESGHALGDLVEAEESPRVVELISANMASLETVGAELRASLALALREEGLTIETIAELFGVTRQRISALLRQKAAVVKPVAVKRRRKAVRR